MSKQQQSSRTYVLGGLFALLAAFPLVTEMSVSDVPLHGSASAEAIERAFEDRGTQLQLRRLRWSILNDCAQREAAGEENVCPDVNDYDALKRYWLPVDHDSADTIGETITATLEQLSGLQTHILRRAARVGQCPENLDGMLSGFQALCEATIGQGDQRINQLEEATERMRTQPSLHYRLKE